MNSTPFNTPAANFRALNVRPLPTDGKDNASLSADESPTAANLTQQLELMNVNPHDSRATAVPLRLQPATFEWNDAYDSSDDGAVRSPNASVRRLSESMPSLIDGSGRSTDASPSQSSTRLRPPVTANERAARANFLLGRLEPYMQFANKLATVDQLILQVKAERASSPRSGGMLNALLANVRKSGATDVNAEALRRLTDERNELLRSPNNYGVQSGWREHMRDHMDLCHTELAEDVIACEDFLDMLAPRDGFANMRDKAIDKELANLLQKVAGIPVENTRKLFQDRDGEQMIRDDLRDAIDGLLDTALHDLARTVL